MSRRIRLLQVAISFALFAYVGIGESSATTPDNWIYVDLDGTSHAFTTDVALMCNNVVDGGTIGHNVSGCANPTFQAPEIASLSLPQGGSGNLEFAWMTTTENPAGGQPVSWTILPNSNSPSFTPPALTASAYYMRCARRAGCTEYAGESNYVVVYIDCCDNATAGGTISGDQTACGLPYDPSLLSNTAAASGGSNGMRYAWYTSTTSSVYTPGDAAWTVVPGVTTPYYDPSAVSGVTYYVRTAQREFCADIGAYSNVVTVNAYPNPTLKADVTDVSCFGESDGAALVTIQNAQAPFTYSWLDNSSTNLNRQNMAAGTYRFEITDANGCTAIEEVVIVSPDELTVSITSDFDLCNFNDDAVLTANVAGGTPPYSYTWSSGETTAALSGKAAGTFTVDVTDANGCTSTATVTINPPARLSATATSTDPICYQANGAINLTVTGGTTPYIYAWTPNVSTTASAINLAGGDYTIEVTDDSGCSTTVSVSLDDTAPITIALDADDVTCNGAADADIRSTVAGGVAPYSYSWTQGNTQLATTATLSNVGPGTYTLTVTDANGCDQAQDVTLTEPNALSATIDAEQPACGEDGGTLTAVISGGTPPYSWNWGTVGQANVQTLTDQPGGDYELNVTDDAGCTFSAFASIDDVIIMELTLTAVDATCPNEDDGSVSVTVTGGEAPYTYQWNDANSQITTNATLLLAGGYSVTVTDNRGCEKSGAVTVENESTGPIISADTIDLNCFGGTDAAIDLTVTGGVAPYSFAWEDNGTPSAITSEDRSGLAAGTYEVTVTDAVGCTNEQTFVFEEPAELTCTASTTTSFLNYFHVSRFQATDGGATVTPIGGAAPYSYAWTNGGATQSINNLPGGEQIVTVTDANGCTCRDTVQLEEPSMISDYVWEDEDGDGIQDATESGLEGVTIRLTGRDFNNVRINFQTTSAADGSYRFDQLPIGSYTLFFTLPQFQDYLFSPADQGGDDTRDSDMDPVLGLVRQEVTAHGHGNYDVDAGFIPRTSVVVISDKAWYDEDHDGIQDPFEYGVQGVTVRLFRSADDLLLNTVVTNEDGEYQLIDVVPGTYYITADQSTSTTASSFVFSPNDAGSDDGLDSDIDPVTMRSGDIVVTFSTQNIDHVDVGLHENCATIIDGGVIGGDEDVCVGDVPGPISSLSMPANAGTYRWYRSTSSMYRGPNDPNWNLINGANMPSYQPSLIVTTVYYIRLVKAPDCTVDFTGASNVIVKRAIPAPAAIITSATSSDGGSNNGNTITMCDIETLTVTADSTSPAVFEWDFGPDATPRYATGRVVQGVSFATVNAHKFYLSVTNPQGCIGQDSFQANVITCFGPGNVINLSAGTSGGVNTVKWSAISVYAGSYFDIERSVEGDAFEIIESMDCIATGAYFDYSFEDRYAPSGEVSYRVTHRSPQVDAASSQSVVVTVEQHELVTDIYPNPAGALLNVALTSAERGDMTYQLLNAFGAEMMTGQLPAGKHQLQLGAIPSGTYYLRIITARGASEVRTVVKQ